MGIVEGLLILAAMLMLVLGGMGIKHSNTELHKEFEDFVNTQLGHEPEKRGKPKP